MERRPRVLVVDDEELTQDFLRFFLSKKFDVFTAVNVSSFYNVIQQADFDLILMDVSLRDSKDGIQLTRELRSSEKYKNVPIFVLTAFNTTRERRNALEAGAQQFLAKPIDAKSLLKIIDDTFSKLKRSHPHVLVC